MVAVVLQPGLHVCTAVSHTPEGNLEGTDCNQISYSSMETLFACVVGRPPTVNREIQFYLNDSIVDQETDKRSSNMVYYHSIDDRFVGQFKIIYVENGCDFWKREFSMGICRISLPKPPIDVARLSDLLRKFRK